uniref:Elongator complex protein 4 n=1 Tax=Apteryx owenii TaxID=8824 RepID=A0A8B9SC37_APTOW
PAAGGAARGHGAPSFQRKAAAGGSRLVAIAGTRPAVRHGQLLLSSGLPSLDSVLGGGLAVGTLLLIEEDKFGVYSNLLFKYFLAEGVVSGHELFVASAKELPANILKFFLIDMALKHCFIKRRTANMEELIGMVTRAFQACVLEECYSNSFPFSSQSAVVKEVIYKIKGCLYGCYLIFLDVHKEGKSITN